MAYSDPYWMFTRAAIADANRVAILSFADEGNDEPIDVTQIMIWSPKGLTHRMVDWQAFGLCVVTHPDRLLVVVGPEGNVLTGGAKGFFEEIVDSSDEGPGSRGILRDVRAIQGKVYAVGMGRQAYRRDQTGVWVRVDKGVVTPLGSDDLVGFNSVDGFSENDIYAVGWKGEIWHLQDGCWQQIQSPTNLKLERVVCAGDGNVYIVGQSGLLIKGRAGTWSIIDHQSTGSQFWGAAWFQEQLWVGTTDQVFVLTGQGKLRPVKFGAQDEDWTCGWLDAAAGMLWSVGSKHLFYTSDGLIWKQVFTKT